MLYILQIYIHLWIYIKKRLELGDQQMKIQFNYANVERRPSKAIYPIRLW